MSKHAPVVDCLRLDFMRDTRINLPTYSLAIIGNSREEVQARRAWILQRLGFQPFHEQWMSAEPEPDEVEPSEDPRDVWHSQEQEG